MLSKNKRPHEPEGLRPAKRVRNDCRDLYANGLLSGDRTQGMLNNVATLTPADVRALQADKRVLGSNTARDLRRSFLKGCMWPQLYWASIRVKNVKLDLEVWEQCAFMLPHEYLAALLRVGHSDVIHDRAGMDPLTLRHLLSCEASAGSRLVALGIWGDGVPCNWDRSESAECFTMNFPGQSGKFKPLRLPLTALSRKQISEHTWFDILGVLSWSLGLAAAGVWPAARHDASAFSKADCKRAKRAGQPLGLRAALAEVRGDWKMFGEVFGFPKWNTKAGVCWRCNCRPDQVSGNTNTTQTIYVQRDRERVRKTLCCAQTSWVGNG
jgi:hypothetical protein